MREANELYDEAGGTSAGEAIGSGFAAGLVVGALLGAGLALLFAPEDGTAVRRRVGRGLRRVRDVAEHELAARRPTRHRGRRRHRPRGREAALQARLRAILDELI